MIQAAINSPELLNSLNKFLCTRSYLSISNSWQSNQNVSLFFSLNQMISLLSLNHFNGSSSFFAFTLRTLSSSASFLFLQQAKSLPISGLFQLAGLTLAHQVLPWLFRSLPSGLSHLLTKSFLSFLPTQSSSPLHVALYPTSISFLYSIYLTLHLSLYAPMCSLLRLLPLTPPTSRT